MTPGTVFLLDLTQAEPDPWSLAPRWGARFFLAFSGYTDRVSAINASVDSLVMPSIFLILSDIICLLTRAHAMCPCDFCCYLMGKDFSSGQGGLGVPRRRSSATPHKCAPTANAGMAEKHCPYLCCCLGYSDDRLIFRFHNAELHQQLFQFFHLQRSRHNQHLVVGNLLGQRQVFLSLRMFRRVLDNSHPSQLGSLNLVVTRNEVDHLGA